MTREEYIKQQAKIELARREFFYFCHALTPAFYKPERTFLQDLCQQMQDFYYSDDDVLVINMPPRHGKSFSASHFAQWVFGINPAEKIMTGSYNETLSTVFSKQVRNSIQEIKAQDDQIVYSDIFPNTKIKRGDGAMNLWSLEGQHNNYLATSPTGTATGFGATLLIIDDLIKNAEEASNDNTLDKHWDWFTNTMLSRLEVNGKIIIIMTRWNTKDLAGRALEELPKMGFKLRHVNMKALQDDGTMLSEDILARDAFDMRVKAMGEHIARANYQQEPIDQVGRLYSSFKTYSQVPDDFMGIYAYCDTADQGDDYLCNIIWGNYNNEAYILDVIYTKEPMEVTEKLVAQAYHKFKVNRARIESNSGGRSFARAVRRILEQELRTNRTDVSWFHQSKNKIARIVSNAPWVMNHVYFPENWNDKWPEFYSSMVSFQREGKNKHDDAQDCITGVAETMYMLGA